MGGEGGRGRGIEDGKTRKRREKGRRDRSRERTK